MVDTTEGIRRELIGIINMNPVERNELEKLYGKVWDTGELTAEFHVHSFLAPYVSATMISTGKKGTLMFQHMPRYYFYWKEE
jgi:hypothetical protein